jgi:hypothetical protein
LNALSSIGLDVPWAMLVPNYPAFKKRNPTGWTILPSGNQKRF